MERGVKGARGSGSSFAAFSVGALVPVLPYLLGATSLLLADDTPRTGTDG
jgi:VIT1/CCC1 family predicted Fe2+/Mn2+ transporter